MNELCYKAYKIKYICAESVGVKSLRALVKLKEANMQRGHWLNENNGKVKWRN